MLLPLRISFHTHPTDSSQRQTKQQDQFILHTPANQSNDFEREFCSLSQKMMAFSKSKAMDFTLLQKTTDEHGCNNRAVSVLLSRRIYASATIFLQHKDDQPQNAKRKDAEAAYPCRLMEFGRPALRKHVNTEWDRCDCCRRSGRPGVFLGSFCPCSCLQYSYSREFLFNSRSPSRGGCSVTSCCPESPGWSG